MYFVELVLVHPHQQKPENQIREGLVDLGRMLGLRLAAKVEDDSPRQAGHIAVNLGIEQVAETDHAAGEGHGDAQTVHYPHEVKAVLLAIMN